jgi:hypothetical protein
MCWKPPYKRLKTKTDETKNTTQYVLETTAQTNTDSVNKTSIFSGYQNDYKHIKAKPRTEA